MRKKIYLFDLFDTVLKDLSDVEFNRGLKILWERHFVGACSFEEMAEYGVEMYNLLKERQSENDEIAFAKDELPMYCKKFGVKPFTLSYEEEAEIAVAIGENCFLEDTRTLLNYLKSINAPMYILSNSIFSAEALRLTLKRYGADDYFIRVWSSADFGKRKPDRSFFDMAVENILKMNPGYLREDIVFTGNDYKYDAHGGCNAGLATIWLNLLQAPNTDNLPVIEISKMSEIKDLEI